MLDLADLIYLRSRHYAIVQARRDAGLHERAVVGVAAAGQRDTDAELADTAAEQVRVDAAVTKGVDHPARPEFVHTRTVACVP